MAVPSFARTARRVLRQQWDGHALSRHAAGKAIPPIHSACLNPAIPMGEAVPSLARTARRALRSQRDGHALSRQALGETTPPIHCAFLKPAIPMGEAVPTQGLPAVRFAYDGTATPCRDMPLGTRHHQSIVPSSNPPSRWARRSLLRDCHALWPARPGADAVQSERVNSQYPYESECFLCKK